jgi:hypothetical protein
MKGCALAHRLLYTATANLEVARTHEPKHYTNNNAPKYADLLKQRNA